MARNMERYTMLAVTPAGYDGTPPPAMPAPEHEDYGERAWTEALMTDLVALTRGRWLLHTVATQSPGGLAAIVLESLRLG